jgi:hypothetical protein
VDEHVALGEFERRALRGVKTPDSRQVAIWAISSADSPAATARSTWTRTQYAQPFSCDAWMSAISFRRSSMPASAAIVPTVCEKASSAS